ncbi:cytidylate kinase [Trichoderma gamsii]|uniref:Cytidylate kinase n=1 Tax=Trichoderma gamsii TaxID=398673 RepID=A0A2P4ZFE7_9HYPO|nr:cytidylate kinase [Trichoderma gamsii]PON23008.1 cytidylate kinase [Trichoderma gamsii]
MAPKTEGIIFVLGAPGAGKGSLSAILAKDYGFKHLSIGDLLRQVVASPDADKTIVDYVRRGELLTTRLLFQTLKPHIEEGGIILLDGFPRRLDQAQAFEREFQIPVLVLFFDCPKDLVEKRVINRKQGREGDNLETFRKRYAEFLELNPPLVHHYGQMEKLVTVNTSDIASSSYGVLLKLLQARSEWDSLVRK